ncbi:MAG: TonB-dependent receptor, partial [Ignavibacteria bacterium]|nr:TonB-dependent receptor [Ignavibacteria bacterium]
AVSGFNLGLGISSTLFDGFDEHAAVALRTTSVDDSADAKEQELSADLHVAGKVEGLDVQGSFGIIWNFFSAPSAMYDPFLLQGQFSTRYTLAQNVELSGGLSLFAFRGSDTRSSGRIYPSLGVSWFAASGVRLFADIGPTIERGRLSDLLERNPYLRTDIGVRPTEHTMRFSVGADGDVAPGFRARLAVTYDRMRDYPLFSDPAFAGTWDIEYRGMTTFLSLDGSLYADLSDNDHAGLNFTVRSTRNTDTEAVPYVPRVHLSGLYSHRFPIDLTLRSSLQVLGSTPVDVNSSRYIPAYAVVSLDAEYSVVHNVELTMKLDNLLDSEQRRFEGYLGYPRSVRLGLRYSW